MTNLHFANLRDGRGETENLARDVVASLTPAYKYLTRARDEARSKKLEVAWEPVEPDAERRTAGFRVRLVPTKDPDEDARLFQLLAQEETLSDDPNARGPRIEVLSFDEDEETLTLARKPEGRFLYVHPNTWTIEAQIRALRALQERPHPDHAPLARLCYPAWIAEWPHVRAEEPRDWYVLTDPTVDGAREQREFVAKALASPDFALLEGPPGSGKTHSVCELILQTVRKGGRVMMCASTHVAVDNVLEKLHKLGHTDRFVVAVRIGNERTVHPDLAGFRLENRARAERVHLSKRLRELAQRSPAQQLMLTALEADGGAKLVENMVLDSANLVCGTTIGILKFAAMRAGMSDDITPSFDLLIVDEASKTTFTEFLVPALRARKWVLVGDVRQLAPYTDGASIAASVRPLVSPREDKAFAAVAIARSELRERPTAAVVWVDDDAPARAEARIRADAIGLASTELDANAVSDGSCRLLWAQFVTASLDAYARHGDKLPPGTFVIGPHKAGAILRGRNAMDARAGGRSPELDAPERWEEAVAWRLTREFELRDVPSQREHYTRALEDLVPAQHRRILDDLRRAALPSVLEVLQRGFDPDREAHKGRAIVHGLPRDVRDARMTSLTFQHRMHPDISAYPRTHVYGGILLRDSSRVQGARGWSYPGYNARATWVKVRSGRAYPRNVATEEVKVIGNALREFTTWAAANPNMVNGTAHPWEVTLLTFYRAQERALRQLVEGQFPPARLKNVVLRVGNVDRFQGREADMVFLSFVRNPSSRDPLGFLDSPNRLNVALTRARHQLVLVGDKDGLGKRPDRSPLLAGLASLPEHKHFAPRRI